ncbi:aspartate/glutamate racemase family protein [Propioniciclava coleopterorum]|uniref:aspartate/glutamate racemase family protein n=1 Tax=Propioniciclava coleopterorum TaxID=2714937 RepID=UPI00197E3ECF|nr:aspartate/glutamate racemase family protein [Propioniciclava coleopterorum]
MIGLIRVVSTLTDDQLALHARAIQHLVGEEEIVTRAIADQPNGIHDDETFDRAVPKIVALGRELAAEGARLLIVSCAADPAVPELREAVDVPVVGPAPRGPRWRWPPAAPSASWGSPRTSRRPSSTCSATGSSPTACPRASPRPST